MSTTKAEGRRGQEATDLRYQSRSFALFVITLGLELLLVSLLFHKPVWLLLMTRSCRVTACTRLSSTEAPDRPVVSRAAFPSKELGLHPMGGTLPRLPRYSHRSHFVTDAPHVAGTLYTRF